MTLEKRFRTPKFSSPRAGIDPGTSSTRGKCITTELPRFIVNCVNLIRLFLVCFPLVVEVLGLSLFCCTLLCVLSSFAIILKRKRELDDLLLLSYGLVDVL